MAKENTMTQTRVCLWTVNEYHRMFEIGIITVEDERVKLIDGQVPDERQKSPHAATTLCASDYLKRSLVEVVFIRVQNPIQLS